MAEPNLVPRTNKGASIGTALKQWAHGFFGDVTIDGNKPLVDANNLGDVADPAAALKNIGVPDAIRESAITRWINENGIWCDGVATGMRAYWSLVTPEGVDQSPGTGDFTLICPFHVPHEINSNSGIIGISDSSSTHGTLYLGLFASNNGKLYLSRRINDSSLTSAEVGTAWVHAHAGESRLLSLVRTGTTLQIFDGSSLLANFTDIDHSDFNFVAANILMGIRFGSEILRGSLGAPLLFNYALSADQIARLADYGPSASDRLGGSMASRITGDSANFAGGTVGNWIATTYSLSVVDQTLRVSVGASEAGNFRLSPTSGMIPEAGRRYLFAFDHRLASGTAATQNIHSIPNGALDITNAEFTPTSTVQTHTAIIAANQTETIRFRPLGTTQPSAAVYEFDNFRLIPLGAIVQPQVGQTAQPIDQGPNRLRGVIMAGCRPLSNRPPESIVARISATGYLVADTGLFFQDYAIAEIWAKPTTSTIPDVTIRRGSSGGTTIVASESAGTEGVRKQLTVIDSAHEGKAGDKLHVTLSPAAEVELEIVWRKL